MAATLKNVLWLVSDDLRPNLNASYGQRYMSTPHLDKFTAEALTFDRAYTNIAICSASRNSFMTGRVPDKTRTWNFINHFRQAGMSGGTVGSTWLTLPQLFKQFNYTVLGHGKMFHPNKPPNNDEPLSWTHEQAYVPLTTTGCPFEAGQSGTQQQRFCPGHGKDGRTDDAAFSDFNTTDAALQTLRTYATRRRPFFIALGLHFPHLAWAVPAWAAELYDATTLPTAKHQDAPAQMPPIAFTAELDGGSGLALDLRNPLLRKSAPVNTSAAVLYYDCPSPGHNTLPLWFQRQLRQGYYAAVSHTDWLFGKVLSTLDELGLTADTLTIVGSDHGWQLGEHGEWGKHTNWELALHVPLLVRAPWKPAAAGQHTGSFTELVDLYRTVAALAGLPSDAVAPDVDGTDVSAVLDAPATALKSEAYSQYPRCPGDRYWPERRFGHPAWYFNNCEEVPASNITAMGYSVRTAEWRLTEWLAWDGGACVARFDAPSLGVELYAHASGPAQAVDFDAAENVNVAALAAHAPVVAELRAKLRKRFDVGGKLGCPPAPTGKEALPSYDDTEIW